MQDKIFEVENSKVVLNQNVLLIPFLKVIVDKYDNYLNALSFLKFYTEVTGPYSDLDGEFKQEKLLEDFPGDYKVTDLEMCVAIERLEEVWRAETSLRFFNSCRIGVNKLSNYLENVILTDDKENKNIADVQRLIEKCLKTIKDFRSMEKIVEEEVLKTRGNKEIAYDL